MHRPMDHARRVNSLGMLDAPAGVVRVSVAEGDASDGGSVPVCPEAHRASVVDTTSPTKVLRS